MSTMRSRRTPRPRSRSSSTAGRSRCGTPSTTPTASTSPTAGFTRSTSWRSASSPPTRPGSAETARQPTRRRRPAQLPRRARPSGRLGRRGLEPHRQQELAALDDAHRLPHVGALRAPRLPERAVDLDVALGPARLDHAAGLADERLGADGDVDLPRAPPPERELADEADEAHGERDPAPRAREQDQQDDGDDQEHVPG